MIKARGELPGYFVNGTRPSDNPIGIRLNLDRRSPDRTVVETRRRFRSADSWTSGFALISNRYCESHHLSNMSGDKSPPILIKVNVFVPAFRIIVAMMERRRRNRHIDNKYLYFCINF